MMLIVSKQADNNKPIITVRRTHCLTGMDLAEHVNMLLIKNEQSSLIQTSQTGGQPYSDTSPPKNELLLTF